ncbi:MAG: two-component regulator propeller domain-containing protein [Bacteroidia bacterium]
MRNSSKYFLSLITALFISLSLFPQAYQFRTYSVDNGIGQPYVYTINQDKKGYLWAGTGDGACRSDGISFKTFYSQDGLAENFVTSSFRDASKNLWLGHNQGGITFYDGKKFKIINTSGFSKSPITCIVSDDKGFIWCATQNDGVFRISRNFEVDVFKMEFNQYNIYSIAITKNSELLAGTGDGLLLYDLATPKRKPVFVKTVPGSPETKVQCIIQKNNSGSYWIGTEDLGLFLLTPVGKGNFHCDAIGKHLAVELPSIQDIYEDKNSNLWIATFGNGIVKLMLSQSSLQYEEFLHFSEESGLGTKYTKCIYADHEENIWIGTYGSGLVQLQDNCFAFYSNFPAGFNNNISAVLVDDRSRWMGTETGLVRVKLLPKEEWTLFSSKNGFVDDKVTALYQPDSTVLIIGTNSHGAWKMDVQKKKFTRIELSEDQLCSSINSITGSNGAIWIATKGGIFKLETNEHTIEHYNTESGLTHNNINQIVAGHDGKLWIATHSNFISYIDKAGDVQNILAYKGNDLINVTSILEDNKHDIWISTFGNGVFRLHDSTITRFTKDKGLRSNYCYSIIRDGSNNIWIGHRGGLSRIKTEKDEINVFDRNEGIPGDCNSNAAYTDSEGYTWFGTTAGLAKFDPHKDIKNLTPPIINITSFKLNDKEVDYTRDTVLPFDNYRLRVDFVGITFKSNTHILFQYKLEGYDADWSDKTSAPYAQYGKLSEGEYTFLLKAYNNDGVSNQNPFSIKIVIAAPVWKRPWFIILCFVLVFYLFYIWLKIRERAHRRFEVQLQKALNEKTREVVIQKEEIEKKNKDITDSIRYAKRIQDAILPDISALKTIAPNSFIFFQPRDIVSGDFYWFKRYGDLLILVCADATGHGVPGAFMSMIGSTLLKDIISRKGIDSPAFSLAILDEEIKILLKQNDGEHHQTQDGVDVIICEINLKTRFLRVASTKRPVIVSKGGELVILKKDSSELLQYETRDIQLGEGDSIYVFTDGFPDQFGGDEGKKIKMANIRTLIEEIQDLPMAKQEMIIDNYFNKWKGGYEQIDDVLFIGLKL